jgi:hypothetical protein
MPTLAEYTLDVQELIHDLASVDFSQSEYTSRINKARKKVALDFHCVRNFFTNLNLIQGQETYPLKGGVSGIKLLSPGQNYVNPIILFSGGGGLGARATATAVKGQVTAPAMTSWGTSYSSTPDIVIIDGPNGYVSIWQLRRAITAQTFISTPANRVFAAILALPPTDPAYIIWNSGGWSIPGDALWLVTRTALLATNPQMAAIYALAAQQPNIVSTKSGAMGQTIGAQRPPWQAGQTATGYPAVSNQQFRLALARPQYGSLFALLSSVSSDPSDPANMIFTSGAPTCFGDPLSAVVTSPSGLGFSEDQAMALYSFAATMTNSVATVTNQQLRLALADPSYGMTSALIFAISSDVNDPANIQWNSGAGSSIGDALATVINSLTFPGGKSLATLYSFAATFPKPQSGSGASAQAICLRNVLDVFSASMIWGNLRPALGWMPFSVFQAYARANIANPQGQPSIWTTHWENGLFYVYQIPNQLYGLELDCVCLPDPLVNTTDIDTQIPEPMSDVVEFYAAHLCMLKLQQYQQSDYFEKKYERRRAEIQATRSTMKRWNIYSAMNAQLCRVF